MSQLRYESNFFLRLALVISPRFPSFCFLVGSASFGGMGKTEPGFWRSVFSCSRLLCFLGEFFGVSLVLIGCLSRCAELGSSWCDLFLFLVSTLQIWSKIWLTYVGFYRGVYQSFIEFVASEMLFHIIALEFTCRVMKPRSWFERYTCFAMRGFCYCWVFWCLFPRYLVSRVSQEFWRFGGQMVLSFIEFIRVFALPQFM